MATPTAVATPTPVVEPTTTPAPLPDAPASAAPVLIPGETVYFYADAVHVGGMTRLDDAEPFKAIVAYAHSDRLVNLLVIDHVGSTFPLESVALYQGDEKDDKLAPCHCETKAPERRKTVMVTGSAGEPIALNLGAEVPSDVTLASAKIKFTVPVGESYTFSSEKAAFSQAFDAGTKPQVLTLTADQIAAGLADLTLTTKTEHDVLLAVTAVEGVKTQSGAIVKAVRTYRFNEGVSFVPVEPIEPPLGAPVPSGTPLAPTTAFVEPSPLASPPLVPAAVPMPPPTIGPAVGAAPPAA